MSTATAKKPATATAAAAEIVGMSDAGQALADLFASTMTVQGATITRDSDPVEANMPPELSTALIKKMQKFRGQVIAAETDALRQKALPEMAKDPSIKSISTSLKFGDDTIDIALERSREFNDGKGGRLVKNGYVNLSYTAKGTSNSGDFKKARTRLSDEATKLFG